jgi:hAT family C-terminal dimerisation region
LPAQCQVARNMFAGQAITDSVAVYKLLSEMPAAFPDLLACFQLALTIPVASASAERSFSAMRRVKTHLRSSMGDNRLSNLALIAVEREIASKLIKNPDKVIDAFANLPGKQRRLELQL